MRTRIVFAVAGGAGLLLALTLFFSRDTHTSAPPDAAHLAQTDLKTGNFYGQASTVEATVIEPTTTREVSDPSSAIPAVQTSVAYGDEIQARLDQLTEWSQSSDPEVLNHILAEVDNPSVWVRSAAVQAAVQFGSRAAIPKLTEVAGATVDVRERAELLEVIAFLELPTLKEWRSTRTATADGKTVALLTDPLGMDQSTDRGAAAP